MTLLSVHRQHFGWGAGKDIPNRRHFFVVLLLVGAFLPRAGHVGTNLAGLAASGRTGTHEFL